MADGDGHADDALLQNSLLHEINKGIAHILRDIGVKPKEEVVQQLVTDIDCEVIAECRDYVFRRAVGVYEDRLEAIGQSSKANLELKSRRGDSADERCADDVVELVLFICGLKSEFPKGVLSAKSTYVDIVPERQPDGHIPGQGRQIAHKECECPCNCGQILREMMDKYDKCERSLCQLKEYVLNVERVMGDAIKEIKGPRSAELSNIELNRPRDQRGHGTNPPEPRSGDNHTADTNLPPTQNNEAFPPLTSPRDSQTEQLTGRDLRQGGHESSLSVLLIDTPPPQGDTQKETGTDVMTLNDSDEIPCGQPVPSSTNYAAVAHQQHSAGLMVDKSTSPLTQGRNTGVSVQPRSTPPVGPVQLQSTPQPRPPAQSLARSSDDVTSGSRAERQQPAGNDDDGFTVVTQRNRRRSDSISESHDRSLRGRKMEPSVELYLQNIARKDQESVKCVADRVRAYCRKKGLRVMSARVIANKFCDDVVGCRITVPIRQTDDALGTRMWPDEVTCRRWRKFKPRDRQTDPAQRENDRDYNERGQECRGQRDARHDTHDNEYDYRHRGRQNERDNDHGHDMPRDSRDGDRTSDNQYRERNNYYGYNATHDARHDIDERVYRRDDARWGERWWNRSCYIINNPPWLTKL